MIDDVLDQGLLPSDEENTDFKTLKNNKLGYTISSTQQYFQTRFSQTRKWQLFFFQRFIQLNSMSKYAFQNLIK